MTRATAASPLPAHSDDPFPHDPEVDDPIGLDDEARDLERTQTGPPQAVEERPVRDLRYGPMPPTLSAREGEVLTAIPAVREARHRVSVELSPGHAEVTTDLELTSTARTPAEARLRLALPPGAMLVSLRVCNPAGCRDAVAESPAERSPYDAAVLARPLHAAPATRVMLPVAHAQLEAEGSSLRVRAAPIAAAAPLTLQVRYDAPAEMHGGTVRFALPPRGMDPRAAQTAVSLRASGLLDARIAGQPAREGAEPLCADPWASIAFSATAPANAPARAHLAHAACDGAACARLIAWAGPRPKIAANLIIALDASPSTEGPARGRLLAAVAALLESAPEGSRVRAIAFAARARTLIEEPIDPAAVSLSAFAKQIDAEDLGAATRFDAAWAHAQTLLETAAPRGKLPTQLVIIGDGGLSERAYGSARASELHAFARAKRAGVRVSTINVADRTATPRLRAGVQQTGGVAIDAGRAAELATTGRGDGPLRDQVGALFAPSAATLRLSLGARQTLDLGELRAGEALVYQGPVDGTPQLRGLHASRPRTRLALFAKQALVAVDPRDVRTHELRKNDRTTREHDWPPPAQGTAAQASRARCDSRGPPARYSGLSRDDSPVHLAEARSCLASAPSKPASSASHGNTAGAGLGKGMPADPLLDMLRARVLPLARGCFRRDRAGRSEYALRAVFAFTLAEREVISAAVTGTFPDALRACLMEAVDALDVPRFTGTVQVRYPLVTESIPSAAQIELTPVAAQAVDTLLGAPGAAP